MYNQLATMTAPITVPAGYEMRPARLADLDEAVPMFNACARELTGRDEIVLENYRAEWEAPGLNLETDVRVVVAPDGQLVGCIEVWDTNDPHVRVHVWGRVHPAHRGRGIGMALLQFAEERAREAIPKAPVGTRVTMSTFMEAQDEPAHALFEAAGFERIRNSWRMAIDLQAPPASPEWPAGIRICTLADLRGAGIAGPQDRALVAAVSDAFHDHWGHVIRPLDQEVAMWQHFMTHDAEFDETLWFVALSGDPETGAEIAGMSLCRPRIDDEPDMGWVGTLGVRRPWRRQGLGLALLLHSFGEFYRRGTRSVGLGVDAESLTGATRLYERAGMRTVREFHSLEKELRAGVEISTQTV